MFFTTRFTLPPPSKKLDATTETSLGAQIQEKANSICLKLKVACGNHWKPVFIVAGIIAAAVGAFMAIPGSMVGGTLPGGIAIGLGCMLIGMAVHGYYREAAYRDLDRPDHRWREPGGDVVYIVEKD